MSDARSKLIKLALPEAEIVEPSDSEPSSKVSKALRTRGVTDIFAQLPPIDWVCRGMLVASGAVTLVGGYGFSGKTVFCQSLALAVASGRQFLGLFSTQQGAVLHLDWEQGFRLTAERYQRLARGMGVDVDALGDRLRLMSEEDWHINRPSSRETLERACDGVALCIVDSLRASCPGVDENSSDFRRPLDVLQMVSGKTGTAFVVVHHARKPAAGEEGTSRYALRGSSGIFDAAQVVWTMHGPKDEPTTVTLEKDRVRGGKVEPFGFRVEDVAGPDGKRDWGLRVEHLHDEQMKATKASPTQAATVDRIVAKVRGLGGEWRGSRRELAAQVPGRHQDVMAAMAYAISTGALEEDGPRGSRVIRLGG